MASQGYLVVLVRYFGLRWPPQAAAMLGSYLQKTTFGWLTKGLLRWNLPSCETLRSHLRRTNHHELLMESSASEMFG